VRKVSNFSNYLYDDMNSRDLAALQEQLQKQRTSSSSHNAEKAAFVRAVKVALMRA
jgi:hypothetical protein